MAVNLVYENKKGRRHATCLATHKKADSAETTPAGQKQAAMGMKLRVMRNFTAGVPKYRELKILKGTYDRLRKKR